MQCKCIKSGVIIYYFAEFSYFMTMTRKLKLYFGACVDVDYVRLSSCELADVTDFTII